MRKQIGFLLIGLFLISCSKTLEYEGKVNDEWVYSYENYDSVGNITSTYPGITSKAHPLFYNGEVYCDMYTTMYGPFGPTFGTFVPRQDGLYQLTSNNFTYLFLKYPAIPNESYPSSSNPTSLITVVSVNDTVNLPYGDLEGVNKYQWTLNGMPKANFWYSPDLWIVKCEEYDSLQDGSAFYVDFSWNLKEYREE